MTLCAEAASDGYNVQASMGYIVGTTAQGQVPFHISCLVDSTIEELKVVELTDGCLYEEATRLFVVETPTDTSKQAKSDILINEIVVPVFIGRRNASLERQYAEELASRMDDNEDPYYIETLALAAAAAATAGYAQDSAEARAVADAVAAEREASAKAARFEVLKKKIVLYFDGQLNQIESIISLSAEFCENERLLCVKLAAALSMVTQPNDVMKMFMLLHSWLGSAEFEHFDCDSYAAKPKWMPKVDAMLSRFTPARRYICIFSLFYIFFFKFSFAIFARADISTENTS